MVNLHCVVPIFKAKKASSTFIYSRATSVKKKLIGIITKIKEKQDRILDVYLPILFEYLFSIAQSIFALSFNLAGLIAGYILASSFTIINSYRWALVLFPGLLSIRGAIGGLYAGRISTGLHLGTIKSKFKDNTDEFYRLNSAIITLTYMSAIILGLLTSFGGIYFFKLKLTEVFYIFIIVLSVMGLSLLVISPSTIFISIQAFLKGLDPDMIVYPAISTIADIMISFSYITILTLFNSHRFMTVITLSIISIIFTITFIKQFITNRDNHEYIETIREFTLTLLCVSFIVNFTGNTLKNISSKIGSRKEIYIIYPALIDTVGDVGSIIGSTATTKISLGLIGSSIIDIKRHLKEISFGWIGSIIMFIAYSTLSSLIYGFKEFYPLVYTVLLTNLIVIPIISFISFIIGIITFKRGLNPDNFIIPIETSLADSITTYILYFIISLN